MLTHELEKYSPALYVYDVRDQLRSFVYQRSREAFKCGDEARDAIGDLPALAAYQKEMRSKFIAALGGLPAGEFPLNAVIAGSFEAEGMRTENVIFESRPNNYVTAALYVPTGLKKPTGAVLFLCGHAGEGKQYPEYMAVCQTLAQSGLVVLAMDPIGQGERWSYYEPILGKETVQRCCREHDYAGSQCLMVGDCIARYFVHDAMRAVDYLAARPEVDPKRIGVTGNSGGGLQTCFLMLCDPRIAAAAPGTFLMNRQSYLVTGGAQDAEQVWPGMTAAGLDHEDCLILMAPRPVRVLAVTSDFFPIEGTRRSVERCRRFWQMHGKPGMLDLVEDNDTHKYTPALAQAATEFFSRHFLTNGATKMDRPLSSLDPRRLQCTQSGQVRGDYNLARFAFEENLERLNAIAGRRNAVDDVTRKAHAMQWLKSKVFNNRTPCELNPRHYYVEQNDDLIVEMCLWWSQSGLFNHAFTFRSHQFAGQVLPVTVAVWDNGTNSLLPHMNWIRATCAAGRAVMVLETTGVGSLLPNPFNAYAPNEFYGVIHKLNDDLIWLGDCLAALRVYDVIRSLDMVAKWPHLNAGKIAFYAHGRQGVYAELAGALDDRIGSVEIVESMGSYVAWVGSRYYDPYDIRSVILPGMLNHFDLPDLERWFPKLKRM